MGDWMNLAEALVLPTLLAVIGLLAWRNHRLRRKKGDDTGCVPDGPEDEPYKVYTDEFDLVLAAEDVPEKLQDASDDVFKGHSDWSGEGWKQRIAAAQRWADGHPVPGDLAPRFTDALERAGVNDPGGVAITLLVDQSGSMRGDPMAAVYNAVTAVADAIMAPDVSIEVLGFSTAGWRGGFAYKRWFGAGAPKRPGRLCALLHIIYKAHGEAGWPTASRDVMLHPDILRENIDGEALEWAAGRLRAVDAGTRVLVVISDGAPVDDMTIMHNGNAYLHRHVKSVIARINGEGDLRLGGVGVGAGYNVGKYYPVHRNADLGGVTEALFALAVDLLAGSPGTAESSALDRGPAPAP